MATVDAFKLFSRRDFMKLLSLKSFGIMGAFVLLASCSASTQNTSGAEYLSKYDGVATAQTTDKDESFEETLRKVAAVEPVLTFPAKIGLARIEQGRLTPLPAEEMETWTELKNDLGEGFGEFVLVNPMIAAVVSESVKTKNGSISSINQVRLAAARQHLDAVLIYEVQAQSSGEDNLLSVGNLTIIGMYVLPSETVKAEGYASAVLFDVLQGYPYGTADVIIDRKTGFTTDINKRERAEEMKREISKAAVEKLAPELKKMLKEVKAAADERVKKQGKI